MQVFSKKGECMEVKCCNDQELVQLGPKSCPRNQNEKQPKLRIKTIQREHTVNRVSSSFQKMVMQNCKRESKVVEPSVSKI